MLVTIWLKIDSGPVNRLHITIRSSRDSEQKEILKAHDYNAAFESVRIVLNETGAVLAGKSRQFYVVYYFQGSLFTDTEISHPPHRILPSRVLQGRIITPVVIGACGLSESEARDNAESVATGVRVLFDLLGNAESKLFLTERGSQNPPVFGETPATNEIHLALGDPAMPLADFHRKICFDFGPCGDALITLAIRQAKGECGSVRNALLAFSDGVRASGISTALSGLAFYSALCSFKAPTGWCVAPFQCPKCGTEQNGHQLGSEADSVIAFLESDVFKGRSWKKKIIVERLKGFSRLHRNAFLHSARRPIGSEENGRYRQPLGPTATAVVNPAVTTMNNYLTVRDTARLAILHKIADLDRAFGKVFESAMEKPFPTQIGPGGACWGGTKVPLIFDPPKELG